VQVAGSELEGRALKINLAPSREGDVWPPTRAESTGGKHIMTTGEQAGGSGKKAMSEKPAECKKLFIGNLSYEIDEDALFKFFDNVGSELKAVRWLSHKETGDFKGCGFAEFWDTEACDKVSERRERALRKTRMRSTTNYIRFAHSLHSCFVENAGGHSEWEEFAGEANPDRLDGIKLETVTF
tara:strand:- start:152 stop:700 length:549 start_codon:yes stop_codon:yes gene_type:complete